MLCVERGVFLKPQKLVLGEEPKKSHVKSSVPARGKHLNVLRFQCHLAPFRGLCQFPLLSTPCRLSLATGIPVTQIKLILSENKIAFFKVLLRGGRPGSRTIYKVGDSTHWLFSLQAEYLQ